MAALKLIKRYATYKGYRIYVVGEDEHFYRVSASGQRIPKELFQNWERSQISEYVGKVPKDDPDLLFQD